MTKIASEPVVSVIMNCRNSAKDLPDALACLKTQTFQDFEIIFYDNASTDKSADIALTYGSQLRYFHNEQPLALGSARNLALSQAQGEFLAFLDCDDLWQDSKLEKQLALFKQNARLGLVCTDTLLFNAQRTFGRLFARSRPARGNVFAQLMCRQWISMSSAMIRTKALPPEWFDERFSVCEEADLFYRIAHDWEADYVDEPLTWWRVHGQNTTFQQFGLFAEETLAILEKHQRLYPNYSIEHADLVRLLTQRATFQRAVDLWRKGSGSKARCILTPYREFSVKNRLFYWISYLPGACFDPLARLYFALPAWLTRL